MEVKNLPNELRNAAKYLARVMAPLLPDGRVTEEVRLMRKAADLLDMQNKILEVAWTVRCEQPDSTPLPDPILRKNEQDRLWKLLDEWKGMSNG